MKVLTLILSIIAATAFAAEAQTKMQETQVQTETGRAKYTEVEPFSFVTDKSRKKISLRPNARRTEPAALPVQAGGANAQEPKRIEGRLADNRGEGSPAPAFK